MLLFRVGRLSQKILETKIFYSTIFKQEISRHIPIEFATEIYQSLLLENNDVKTLWQHFFRD